MSTFSYQSSNSPLNFGFTTNESNTNLMPNYKIIDPQNNGAIKSLFGNTKFIPFPTGVDKGKGTPQQGTPGSTDPDFTPGTGDATGGKGQNRTAMHNDDVYDTSIMSLIDYTKKQGLKSMLLSAAHFAYLKDVGVYPNNRLMIARRFPAPVGNDLTAVTATPLSTLISWVPNDNEFMDISFGEHWEEASGSFQDVLDGIGKDTTLSEDNRGGMGALGQKFYQGFDLIPFPGLMEGLQREVMKKMGIIDDKDPTILPQGNPNLIKQAMKRRVVAKGQAGSGLKCKFSVKMKVEYEQKYINGLDNTLAYFDLIANVLSFATSESQFQYNKIYAGGATGILSKLVSGDISAVVSAITGFVKVFVSALMEQARTIAKNIQDAASGKKSKSNTSQTNDGLKALSEQTIGAVVGKYKMSILGIISSLTGQPSTPWHITIGNPKRPVFSSGDMLMEEVQLKLGPVLSWNDLPSSISIEFTLTNARPLGAQEIFNRFNTGKGRSYVRIQSDITTSKNLVKDNEKGGSNDFEYSRKLPTQATNFGPSSVTPNQSSNQNPNNTSGNILRGNGTDTPIV